jgi:hypothetical protein
MVGGAQSDGHQVPILLPLLAIHHLVFSEGVCVNIDSILRQHESRLRSAPPLK